MSDEITVAKVVRFKSRLGVVVEQRRSATRPSFQPCGMSSAGAEWSGGLYSMLASEIRGLGLGRARGARSLVAAIPPRPPAFTYCTFVTKILRVALTTGLCLDLTDGGTWNWNVMQLWQCGSFNMNQAWYPGALFSSA